MVTITVMVIGLIKTIRAGGRVSQFDPGRIVSQAWQLEAHPQRTPRVKGMALQRGLVTARAKLCRVNTDGTLATTTGHPEML